MVETIVQSIASKLWNISNNLVVLLPALRGKQNFEKRTDKTQINPTVAFPQNFTELDTSTHLNTYTRIYICICIHIHIYTYTHIYIDLHKTFFVYIYILYILYIYIYIHMEVGRCPKADIKL